MNMLELIAQAKTERPKALGELPEKTAKVLMATVFASIRKEIELTEKGVVKVDGLGAFHVRLAKVQKEGEEKEEKRVRFSAGKKNPAKAGAGKRRRGRRAAEASDSTESDDSAD